MSCKITVIAPEVEVGSKAYLEPATAIELSRRWAARSISFLESQ
jgi:hypothetical protein